MAAMSSDKASAFGLTDLPSQQESDDPIPTHILLNVAKKSEDKMARLHAPNIDSEHRASPRDADELEPRVTTGALAETGFTSRSPTRPSNYPR